MRTRRSLTSAFVLGLLFVFLVFPVRSAYAYIDPGTGSFILQMLIAGVVGSAFAIKMCWKRIRMFFATRFSRSKDGEPGRDQ